MRIRARKAAPVLPYSHPCPVGIDRLETGRDVGWSGPLQQPHVARCTARFRALFVPGPDRLFLCSGRDRLFLCSSRRLVLACCLRVTHKSQLAVQEQGQQQHYHQDYTRAPSPRQSSTDRHAAVVYYSTAPTGTAGQLHYCSACCLLGKSGRAPEMKRSRKRPGLRAGSLAACSSKQPRASSRAPLSLVVPARTHELTPARVVAPHSHPVPCDAMRLPGRLRACARRSADCRAGMRTRREQCRGRPGSVAGGRMDGAILLARPLPSASAKAQRADPHASNELASRRATQVHSSRDAWAWLDLRGSKLSHYGLCLALSCWACARRMPGDRRTFLVS